MKFQDLLHISTGNIRAYLKRNIITMMVMGIIFGLIFAMNLWLQGVENNYRKYASEKTNGKVVILARNVTNEISVNPTDTKPTLGRNEMIKDIEACGGTILNDVTLYGGVMLPQYIVEGAIEVDINAAPADAMPILVTTSLGEYLLERKYTDQQHQATTAAAKQKDYEEYRKAIIGKTFTDAYGAKYFVVGTAVDNFGVSGFSFQQLEKGNDNVLNYILQNISSVNGSPIIIDNGRSTSWQVGENLMDDIGEDIMGDMVLAVFENNDDAYGYLKNGKAKFPNLDTGGKLYSASVVAGMSPEQTYVLRAMKVVANIISVVLAIVAAAVVVFTSIRLVDNDRENIALYYRLGATKRQVRLIYLCYFAELMFGAFIFAFGMALLVVFLYSVVNQDLLSIQSELAFSLPAAPRVVWCSVNWSTLITIIVMLLLSEACVLVNHRRLDGELLENTPAE